MSDYLENTSSHEDEHNQHQDPNYVPSQPEDAAEPQPPQDHPVPPSAEPEEPVSPDDNPPPEDSSEELQSPEAGDDAQEDEDASEGEDEEDAGEGVQPMGQADTAMALIEAAEVELWHDPDDNAYATVRVDGHQEHLGIGTRAFRDFVSHRYWTTTRRRLSKNALDEVIETLAARARFEGPLHDAFIRVAHADGNVYVDLCNDKWEAIEINEDGFKVISHPPVRFVRRNGMQPLPHPRPALDAHMLERLKTLLNLPQDNDRTFTLLVAYLIGVFNPAQVYAVLALIGPHGSGKSTLSRYLRALIDPHTVPIQGPPRNEQELVIAASNSFLLAFDNLSGLRPWLSDAFCRLATGSGFRTRKLYEGREEELFFVSRPIHLNGISNVIEQNDLADRAILVSLHAISTRGRQAKEQLDQEFAEVWPDLLGAIYAAVSEALRNRDSVSLEHTPRMADFALWVKAAEGVLPFPPGSFEAVYLENQQQMAEESVEHDEVASAVLKMMKNKVEPWKGSITDLAEELDMQGLFSSRHPNLRAMSPRKLLERLLRAAPVLRRMGIEVDYDPRRKDPRTRRTIIIIRIIRNQSSLFSGK